MRTALHPFFPNGAGGDPALWVDLTDEGKSVLVDLGDLRTVPNRRLLRVDRVVVTHTHMDHFVGFDHLLRVVLGRERELVVTGPAGFLGHVQGKIAAYTWNLIEEYPLRIVAEEIDGGLVRALAFSGRGGMRPEPLPDRPFHGTVHGQRELTIHATTLDHGTPVLAVALRESEHLSVNKDRLERLGLSPGPWLSELKQVVRRGGFEGQAIEADTVAGGRQGFRAGDLAAELLLRTPGQTLAYVTDLRWTEENRSRVVELASGVDLLICEAAFLHADEALARARSHLTARQAGELAREAGAKRLAPFHFSARYQGRESELVAEASASFGGPVVELPRGPVFAAPSG